MSHGRDHGRTPAGTAGAVLDDVLVGNHRGGASEFQDARLTAVIKTSCPGSVAIANDGTRGV